MKIGVLFTCALLLMACTDEADTTSPDVTSPDVTIATEDDGCQTQRLASGVGDTVDNEPLQADINEDGIADRVKLQIARETAEDRDCRAFLVVEVLDDDGGGVAVSEPVWKAGPESGLEEPSISSFVQIDDRPGLEIVVHEMSGASTQFVGAFTLVGDTLERIKPAEASEDIWAGAADGVFPYGGSVGHIEGVDCVDGGEIVVSVALPAGPSANTYVVARRFFEIDGAELALRDTERVVATAKEVFDDIPEFRASPFGSCAKN